MSSSPVAAVTLPDSNRIVENLHDEEAFKTLSTSKNKQTLLFVAQMMTDLRELVRVADYLNRTAPEAFEAVFFLLGEDHWVEEQKAFCQKMGVCMMTPDDIPKTNKPKKIKKPSFYSLSIKPFLKKGLAFIANYFRPLFQFLKLPRLHIRKSIMQLLWAFIILFVPKAKVDACLYSIKLHGLIHKIYQNQIQLSTRMLKHLRPNWVVLGEDGMGASLSFIRAFKLYQETHSPHSKMAVVPYNFPSLEEPYSYIFNNLTVSEYTIETPFNKLIAKLFPNWVSLAQLGKIKLLRHRPEILLSMLRLKMAPKHPWLPTGNFADLYLLDGDAAVSFYQQFNIPASKITTVGSLAHDGLFEGLQSNPLYWQAYIDRKKIHPKSTNVLLTLPPDYFRQRQGCAFQNFSELLNFYNQTLSKLDNVHVTVQLHPAVHGETRTLIQQVCKQDGFLFSDAPIVELIPKHDVMIATVSSTIRWATLCHKPVINFDMYGFRYSDYENTPGVLTTEDATQVKLWLEQLCTTDRFYETIAWKQAQAAAQWGKMDGQVGERLLKALC